MSREFTEDTLQQIQNPYLINKVKHKNSLLINFHHGKGGMFFKYISLVLGCKNGFENSSFDYECANEFNIRLTE